ncbi:hypothetical protein [Allosphingosinicella vermicomposti]|uniref:hypothetical protein n=1 Tax=Allosphingosinicella vermicomposti TaxID=614671 RepID=UPI000D0FE96B|nr:hypothetical protein [Allosphingosinicella vermicomposti]
MPKSPVQHRDTLPDLPAIVRVSREGVTDATEIDTDIYCANLTPTLFHVEVRSASFTTVDEETGAALAHGADAMAILLAPGATARIGDVAGWEWDGFVGLDIIFQADGATSRTRCRFRLGESVAAFKALGIEGRLIAPSGCSVEDMAPPKPGVWRRLRRAFLGR